jgi:hypothetical protein
MAGHRRPLPVGDFPRELEIHLVLPDLCLRGPRLGRAVQSLIMKSGKGVCMGEKLLTLAKDVLALTKVNWNMTQFDQ